MLSSQDRAAAHYGAVTGLKVTEDGMYLLSAGWVISFWTFVIFKKEIHFESSIPILNPFNEVDIYNNHSGLGSLFTFFSYIH